MKILEIDQYSKALELEIFALTGIYTYRKNAKVSVGYKQDVQNPEDPFILLDYFEKVGVYLSFEVMPHNGDIIHSGKVINQVGEELFNTFKPKNELKTREDVKMYLINNTLKMLDAQCNINSYTFPLSHVDTDNMILNIYGLTGLNEWININLLSDDYDSKVQWFNTKYTSVFFSNGKKFRWRVSSQYNKIKSEYEIYATREIFLDEWVNIPHNMSYESGIIVRQVNKNQSDEIIQTTKKEKIITKNEKNMNNGG